MHENPYLERRYKRLLIGQRWLLDTLRTGVDPALVDCVRVPVFEEIPSSAFVHSVYFDFGSQCFGVVVWDESFEIVPEGSELPIISKIGGAEFRVLKKANNKLLAEEAADIERLRREAKPIKWLSDNPTEGLSLAKLKQFRDQLNAQIYDLERNANAK